MRIGINCFVLDHHVGGIKQYFFTLMQQLLAKADHEYVLFYFQHNIKELENAELPGWKTNSVLLDNQEDILENLRGIDLYYCPFNALWPRPVPVPSVFTLHDIQEKYFPGYFTPRNHFDREYHHTGSLRAADTVITVSEFSKDSILKHFKVDPAKIVVIHNAADPVYAQPDAMKPPAHGSVPDDCIMYPANTLIHKNHDVMLRALKFLREQKGRVIQCIFSGAETADGYPLRDKISEYELDDQATMLGYLSASELKYCYRKSLLLCFPSRFEGFGLPVLEAMVNGCPVVCARSASLPEIAGDAALYFEPDDYKELASCITKIADNPDLRDNLIQKGFQRQSIFSVESMVNRHLEVFEETLKNYKRKYYLPRLVSELVLTIKVHRKHRHIVQYHMPSLMKNKLRDHVSCYFNRS